MKRTMLILAVPGVQLLDVSGPLDVFAEANRILKREVYQLCVMALQSNEIHSSSGVKLIADRLLSEDNGDLNVDTFLIAGAPDAADTELATPVRQAITSLCHRSRRYGSVCTGALLLAQTGLLLHRRVTTHWVCANLLASRYPEITVDENALYVADGPLRTAAGVTSGMDLALRLVEEDLGREVALDVASNLVMFFRRPVDQGHYSRKQQISLPGRTALQDLLRWAAANLSSISGLQDMAVHIDLSIRHLNRLFRQELNQSAGEWLEKERIAKARQLLEEGTLPVKAIAPACGYTGSDVLRRVFVKHMSMTPSLYRKFYLQTAE